MNTIGCKVIKVSMIFVDSVKYFLKRLQSYGSYEVAQGTTIMSSSKKYRRLQSCIGYDDFADSEKYFSNKVARLRRLRGCTGHHHYVIFKEIQKVAKLQRLQ